FQTVCRALTRQIGKSVPVWIVEVDDVHCRDADIVQGNMVVKNRLPDAVLKGSALQLRGDPPQILQQGSGLQHRVLFRGEMRGLAGNHVEKYGGDITVWRPITAIASGEILRTEKILIAFRVKNVFLAVEQHEVDANLSGEFAHVVSQLHQQSHARS